MDCFASLAMTVVMRMRVFDARLTSVMLPSSDIAAAERFYDAIMKTLDVVKVGRREDWLGYGETGASGLSGTACYLTIRERRESPDDAFGLSTWCFTGN